MATNDQLSFVELIRRFQVDIWRYLRVLGAEQSLADDLTQETFVAVYRKPFEYRGEAEASAYLRTVARNLFLMAKRKERSGPAFHDIEGIDRAWVEFSGEDGGNERIALLKTCMQTLDQRTRAILEARYGYDTPREEIAAQFELELEALRSLIRRAKETLAACIERKAQ
ncbi:MAG: sigma-70 family RNA polymerase sigma factor [Planctomycetes bacterium]|nr:sigma-70 family RNA polymerase sigma factor [Planctomycetota bacterium]NUQ34265.1 sigma-70 family RNA polymerase sigma factor [Planctomycetaceae bacterium]